MPNLILMLDASYPPAPDAWIADLRALGARVAAIYAYQPPDGPRYTQAHVTAALNSGIRLVEIFTNLSDNVTAADLGRSFHLCGAVAFDLELGSALSLERLNELSGELHAAGYGSILVYGAVAYGYPWWKASWIQSLYERPAPSALPPGTVAWQYANNVKGPSGATYDVSIVDADLVWPTEKQQEEPFMFDIVSDYIEGEIWHVGPAGPNQPRIVQIENISQVGTMVRIQATNSTNVTHEELVAGGHQMRYELPMDGIPVGPYRGTTYRITADEMIVVFRLSQ